MDPARLEPILGPAAQIALMGLSPFLLLPALILALGRAAAEVAAPATDLIESASAFAERCAQVLLGLLVALIALSVALRYVFGVGSTALQEGALYAHGLAFLLAAPACAGRDGHVRVDVFYGGFSPRAKAWTNLIAFHLLIAPALLILLATSQSYVAGSWRIGERSVETDGLPIVYLVKTAIPLFAALLLAQTLAGAARAACLLREIAPAPERFLKDREGPA